VGYRTTVGGHDRGADTVVGFVLVTGISLLMISVVMLMGAPALEQVQSRQQTDSMIGSFQRLDRGVSTLLSGAPAGTTPAWQVSMADGSMSLDEGGKHLWGYNANIDRNGNTYEVWFGEYADGDDQVKIHNNGTAFGSDEFQLEAYRYEAGEEVAQHIFNRTSLSAGSNFTINDPAFWDLEGHSTQFKIFDRGNSNPDRPVAHAWFIDGGAVEWELSRGGSMTRILDQNTAIVAAIDGGQVMHNTPRLRAPDDSGEGTEDVFVRVVKLEGALATGGRSSTEVLVSSQGNHERVASGNATKVQIYPPTSMSEAWERYLTNEKAGFTYTWEDGFSVFDGKEAAVWYTSNDRLSTSLVETTVTLSRSGGT
jgi:hypothetical protein